MQRKQFLLRLQKNTWKNKLVDGKEGKIGMDKRNHWDEKTQKRIHNTSLFTQFLLSDRPNTT